MRIRFKNFKGHRNGEFELPDEGLILLFGENGSGKSSLLNGIVYALYGKIKKPFSHGKTSCEVELVYKKLNIQRTSNPNCLRVEISGEKFEGEIAQLEINNYIGMDHESFRISSYATQDHSNSVIAMTSAEQLKFIETLAFRDGEHKRIRLDIKNLVKTAELNLSEIEGELKATNRLLRDKKSSIPKDLMKDSNMPDFPDVDELNSLYSKKSKSLELCRTRVEKYRQQIEKNKQKEKAMEGILKEDSKLATEIEQLRSLLENMVVLPKDEVDSLKSNIDSLKDGVTNLKIYNSYRSERKRFEELKKNFLEELASKVVSLEESLLPDKEINDLKKKIGEFEMLQAKQKESEHLASRHNLAVSVIENVLEEMEAVKYTDRRIKNPKSYIKSLEKRLKSVNTKISQLEEEPVGPLECPCCKKSLSYVSDTLIKFEKSKFSNIGERNSLAGTHNEMKQDILRWIQVINENIDDYELEISEPEVFDNQTLLDYERKLNQDNELRETWKQMKSNLENEILDSSLERLHSDVKNKRKLLPKRYKPGKESVSNLESELQKSISKFEEALRNTRDVKTLEKKIGMKISERGKLESHVSQRKIQVVDIEKLESEYSKAQILSGSLLEEISRIQSQLEIARKYDSLLEVDKLEGEVKRLEVEISEKELEYKGALGLLEASREAELLAMEHTLYNINEHAARYLEEMFSKPISVRLTTCQRGSKTGKKQIVTSVSYKGSDSGGIFDLSGGEKQKCELAFLLAVHDILGGKILMLDERLNNMDTEVNMDVLNFLKRCCSGTNRIILVISHEAVHGVFDHVIDIHQKIE